MSGFRCLLLLLLACAPPASAEDLASYDLQPEIAESQCRRAKVLLEVEGRLKLNADGQAVQTVPLKARGQVDYYERTLAYDAANAVRQDVRFYREATATIDVADNPTSIALRPARGLLVLESHGPRSELVSPWGPLTHRELELVNVPANSALIDQLLPADRVQVGDEWSHPEALMASLLRWDSVHENSSLSRLREVKAGVAIVDLEGTLAGAVGGVAAEVELKAVYNFDLAQRRITWVSLTLDEQRAIGHAEPGFEVTARLRMATRKEAAPPQLADNALRDLELTPGDAARLLSLHTQSGFQLLHDRKWRVMVDRHDVAILRLIDRGDLIAQCNASGLTPLEPGQQLELAAFQEDVKRALGDSFGQFVEASQQMTDAGLRVLRVVVAGVVSELPIQWTYYHLSNSEGRQAAIVFTIETDLVEAFGGRDQALVSSFEFRPLAPLTPVNTSDAE